MPARPTETTLQALRDSLPAFELDQAATPELLAWWDFYGLDIAATCAGGAIYQCGTVPSGQFQLAVHRWLQPGATSTLFLVHGYTDHSGLFRHLVEYGLRRGDNVVIFDLPGHGLSSGAPGLIDSFQQYGRAVHDVFAHCAPVDQPARVIAQSTGCSALIELARHFHWPFVQAVLLAPLLRPAGWRWVRVAHFLLRPFTSSVKRKFNHNSSDQYFLVLHRNDPLQPRRLPLAWVAALRTWLAGLPLQDLGIGSVLVLQGDQDSTVDWRYNTAHIGELFPNSRIELLAGAGHQLANESPATRQRYYEMMDSFFES